MVIIIVIVIIVIINGEAGTVYVVICILATKLIRGPVAMTLMTPI